MSDLSEAIQPKADQLTADDLIAGPLTLRITKVSVAKTPEQPVAISFEGDQGKPWKPCKSMTRVLVQMWGPDSAQFAGRSVTVYRDPGVKWGGLEVGGIRISHMSHIERSQTMALTVTRGSKKPFTVKPLVEAKPVAAQQSGEAPRRSIKQFLDDLEARLAAADNLSAVEEIIAGQDIAKALVGLTNGALTQLKAILAAAQERYAITGSDAPDDGSIPTDLEYLTAEAEKCETLAKLEQMQQAGAIRKMVIGLTPEDAAAYGITITALREGFGRQKGGGAS